MEEIRLKEKGKWKRTEREEIVEGLWEKSEQKLIGKV